MIRRITRYIVRSAHNKIYHNEPGNRNVILNITGRMHHLVHNTSTSIKTPCRHRHRWKLVQQHTGSKSYYSLSLPEFPPPVPEPKRKKCQYTPTLLLPLVKKLSLFRMWNYICLLKPKVKGNVFCTITLNI